MNSTINILIDNNINDNLINACKNNNLEQVKYYVENGANINYINKDWQSAIFMACLKGNLEIVKYLVEHGADINIIYNYKVTCLNIACRHNNLDVVEYLINKDAFFDENDYVVICEVSNYVTYKYILNYIVQIYCNESNNRVKIDDKYKISKMIMNKTRFYLIANENISVNEMSQILNVDIPNIQHILNNIIQNYENSIML